MNLKPALCHSIPIHGKSSSQWTAWDSNGKSIIEGMGTFDAFAGRLKQLGYFMLPMNSAAANEIKMLVKERCGL